MTPAIKKKLDQEWQCLERACEQAGRQATELLEQSFDHAVAEEKGHRSMGAGCGTRYELSVPAVARYMVLRAFWGSFGLPSMVRSALDAVSTKPAVLYPLALRQLLNSKFTVGHAPGESSPICLTIEYAGDIARTHR